MELRLELRVMGTGSCAGTGLRELQSQRATQSKLKGLEVCGLWVISLRCLQRDVRAWKGLRMDPRASHTLEKPSLLSNIPRPPFFLFENTFIFILYE